MVYGSLSGGLWVLELDKTTGKPIYPGKDGTDSISNNYVDRYFGIHIAGGNHMSWEGGYIRYYKKSGYYFFYDTYRGGINSYITILVFVLFFARDYYNNFEII